MWFCSFIFTTVLFELICILLALFLGCEFKLLALFYLYMSIFSYNMSIFTYNMSIFAYNMQMYSQLYNEYMRAFRCVYIVHVYSVCTLGFSITLK